MKKTLTKFSIGIALAAMLTTVANASLVTYDWVPDTALNGANTSSGSLTWDTTSSLVSTFSFTLNAVNTTAFTPLPSPLSFVLTDGNLVLVGKSDTTQAWSANDVANTLDENVLKVLLTKTAYGDWVAEVTPVPEPTTIIAGVLLLLPFGASTLRILRKNRAA